MAKKTSGSNLELLLNGVSFDLAGDANFTETGSNIENELVATSGGNIVKKMKRPQIVESVTVVADADEFIFLQDLSKSIETFPMSYTTADGTLKTASGTIDFESRETEENRATIKLLPVGEWQSFVAS